MKGEIDKDFYCLAARSSPKITCDIFEKCRTGNNACFFRLRKWPTPEQYLEEYGEDYPDSGAVYCFAVPVEGENGWRVFDYRWYKNNKERYAKDGQILYCVCACTPWGEPPYDWRL